MGKKSSVPKAKPIARKKVATLVPRKERHHRGRVKQDDSATGLAGIAGGWKGSEELADLLGKYVRRGCRSVVDLES